MKKPLGSPYTGSKAENGLYGEPGLPGLDELDAFMDAEPGDDFFNGGEHFSALKIFLNQHIES